MICPECNTKTSTLLRTCEHCDFDLEAYKAERNSKIAGTGFDDDMGSDNDSIFVTILRFLLPIFSVIFIILGFGLVGFTFINRYRIVSGMYYGIASLAIGFSLLFRTVGNWSAYFKHRKNKKENPELFNRD